MDFESRRAKQNFGQIAFVQFAQGVEILRRHLSIVTVHKVIREQQRGNNASAATSVSSEFHACKNFYHCSANPFPDADFRARLGVVFWIFDEFGIYLNFNARRNRKTHAFAPFAAYDDALSFCI